MLLILDVLFSPVIYVFYFILFFGALLVILGFLLYSCEISRLFVFLFILFFLSSCHSFFLSLFCSVSLALSCFCILLPPLLTIPKSYPGLYFFPKVFIPNCVHSLMLSPLYAVLCPLVTPPPGPPLDGQPLSSGSSLTKLLTRAPEHLTSGLDLHPKCDAENFLSF